MPVDFRDCWVWISSPNETIPAVVAVVVVVAAAVGAANDAAAVVVVADAVAVAAAGASVVLRASFAAVPPCALQDMRSFELVSFYQCSRFRPISEEILSVLHLPSTKVKRRLILPQLT